MQKSRLESLGELAAGIAHEIKSATWWHFFLAWTNILYQQENNALSPDYLNQKN